ncbi:MAG: hypothetical protein LBR10_04285 [Prevotellaceae bacterium]|jgi:flagellar biosynthesis protein FliR|nr:hypothetical protein [Prevotellaceae bacterium]
MAIVISLLLFSIPLAIIGGLIILMFLTLAIVPPVHYVMDKMPAKFGRDRKKEIMGTSKNLIFQGRQDF